MQCGWAVAGADRLAAGRMWRVSPPSKSIVNWSDILIMTRHHLGWIRHFVGDQRVRKENSDFFYWNLAIRLFWLILYYVLKMGVAQNIIPSSDFAYISFLQSPWTHLWSPFLQSVLFSGYHLGPRQFTIQRIENRFKISISQWFWIGIVIHLVLRFTIHICIINRQFAKIGESSRLYYGHYREDSWIWCRPFYCVCLSVGQ